MNRYRNLFLKIAALFVAAVWCVLPGIGRAETLTILHVNDTHTHLSGWGPHAEDFSGNTGGYDRLATLVGMERAQDDQLLLLNAGDNSMGDMVFNLYLGIPEYGLQKALGFDAMAVGNHEFDLGPDILLYQLSLAGMLPGDEGAFPLICANLDYSLDTTGLANVIHPYEIFERKGIRIGIFSLLTPTTMLISSPFNPATGIGVIVRSDTTEVMLGIAGEMVRSLREDQNCQVVIALTHLGILYDIALAQYVPGIDLVIGGHQHIAMDTTITNLVSGANVPFVATSTALAELGKIVLNVDSTGVHVTDRDLIPINADVPRAAPMTEQLNGIVAMAEDSLDRPFYTQSVAECAGNIPWQFTPGDPSQPNQIDSPLGNLITDAIRSTTGTDIAFEAYGFLRQDLYDGHLSEADIYQAIGTGFDPTNPNGFALATYQVSGEKLATALTYTVNALVLPYDLDFLILPSGMGYSFDLTKENPMEKVTAIWVGDQPIDFGATYTISSSIILPKTLEGIFGIEVDSLQPLATTEYEAVRDYIIAHSPVSATTEGRVLSVGRDNGNGSRPVNAFILNPAYPNPFNQTTIVGYNLPRNSPVTLTVYDLAGREVARLLSGPQIAGAHSVMWNAARQPSGCYLIRLGWNGGATVQRCSLVK